MMATMWGSETKVITVSDESGMFQDRLKSKADIAFEYSKLPYPELKAKTFAASEDAIVLHIPAQINVFDAKGVELTSPSKLSLSTIGDVENALEDQLKVQKMSRLQLRQGMLDSIETRVDITVKQNTLSGDKESSSAAASGFAFGGGFLIYIFIFIYGGMVLRAVQEEKQSRVIEVLISSVKPFQFMMGKILGIALLGLTQFVFWIILTMTITTVLGAILQPDHAKMAADAYSHSSAGQFSSVMKTIASLNIPLILGLFLFYFIGGYLLYSSLFAAVGSAVDSQADAGQLMLPISIPIIFSIAMLTAVINDPMSNLAVILSMIPLTSPIIMIARVPFDVPVWQLILSMSLLILGFIGSTWLAGRIYRVGILMYGKKASWKELGKWLFY